MNFFERIIYFLLFVMSKHTGFIFLEKILNYFENKMINKYIVREEIPSLRIPTIAAKDLTDELFLKLSNNYRDPVLIKNFMTDTNAIKKWNLSYLNNIIGDFKINTIKYTDKFEIENMTFSDFADRIDTDDIYINNNHTILGNFPQLFEDIEPKFKLLLKILKSCNLSSVHIANLFIGFNNDNKKCTGSSMHCGGSGNFFCMLQGSKHWTLIHPKYSCLLKGRVASTGIHAQTMFDMGDIEIDRVPKIFKYLHRYEIEMVAGDILYNPPWWWHRIRNYDGFSVGMAIRNNKVTKLNLLNNLTYTMSGYKYLLYNTLVLEFYERFVSGNKNFTASKSEHTKGNVLYEIEKLMKKYPKSLDIDTVLQ
jgi:hypothetical protein